MMNKTARAITDTWREFIRLESAGGMILVAAAVFAMILANSPLADLYSGVLGLKLTVMVEDFGVSKPFILWINDGLMAVFFLLVGLELKREVVEGQLSSPDLLAGQPGQPARFQWLGHPHRHRHCFCACNSEPAWQPGACKSEDIPDKHSHFR
jgi:hypothetical protein